MAIKLRYNLSKSSEKAMNWAYTWKETRQELTSSTKSNLVNEVDILVGVMRSYGENSLPQQILHYFNIPIEQLNNKLEFEQDSLPPDILGSPEDSDLSEEAARVLERSAKLAEQYNSKEEGLVRIRDLFGGILNEPSSANRALRSTLESAQITFDDLVSTYTKYLKAPKDVSLSSILIENFPKPEPKSIQLAVSGFSSDTRSERDLIGIGSEVDAFAYLIANKDLQPPLAIGLFGDWGAGKTYFMQSVKERVNQITNGARNSGQPQKDLKIFKYVVQIEFNAWHYVEGELWASLVESIFQNLQTRPGDKPSLLQQRQKVWFDKLETLREQQGVAQILKDDLEAQRVEKEKQINKLEKERDKKLTCLNELKAEDVLATIKLTEKDQEKLNGVLRELGVTESYSSAIEFMGALSGMKSTLERGNALTMVLRQRGWKWTLGVIAVVVSGPLVSVAIMSLSNIQIPAVTNALVSISAFLGGLTALLKAGTSKLAEAINEVEQAQFELDLKRRNVEKDYANRITVLEDDIVQITKEYQQRQSEELEISQKIKAVEQELQQITPRRVLLDFIQERAGSEDYSKRLGIAALIRRDFEQLWQLIQEQNKEFIKRDDGVELEADQHLINRIVLYIDDLDRCPPERVVHVLQAAHLLLAFPLFVVVIAVDARWLSQSLQTHYEGLLDTDGQQDENGSDNGLTRPATPQNYLEKIFQIPFWVKPLPEGARKRIVQGLVEKSLIEKELSETSMARDNSSIVEYEPDEAIREFKKDAITNPNPPSLDILGRELKFMENMKALLGRTPRSVKRFVNIYWLMKSVAINQSDSFVQDSPHADYKQVLFLLAVLTGLPILSHEFFLLLGEDNISDNQVVKNFNNIGKDEVTLRQVIENLKKIHKTNRQIRGEINDFRKDLSRLELWLEKFDDGSWMNISTNTFRRWLPQVTRFSYRMEHI